MKIVKLLSVLVVSLTLTGCLSTEIGTGTESGMEAVHLKNVASASFSVDPLEIGSNGAVSNSSTEDVKDYTVNSDTDIEVTVLDRSNGTIKELNWDEFYSLWSQTDAFSEETVFDFLYEDTQITDSETDKELSHKVTIRITERS